MPTLSSNYKLRCQRLKERRARLLAKGLNPRSQKFYKLLYKP
jgi:hypothetical protein